MAAEMAAEMVAEMVYLMAAVLVFSTVARSDALLAVWMDG